MKGKIKKSDCIASMIFITILFFVFSYKPDVMGWYINETGPTIVVPFFNLSGIKEYSVLIRVIFTMAILREALGIYWGRWTLKNATIYSVMDIANTVLVSIFVLQPSIWNSNFISDVNKAVNDDKFISMINAADFRKILYGFIIVSLVIASIEAASHIYKGYRYRDMNESV